MDDGFSGSASLSLTGLDAESPSVEDSVCGTSGGVGSAATGAEATAIKVCSLMFSFDQIFCFGSKKRK